MASTRASAVLAAVSPGMTGPGPGNGRGLLGGMTGPGSSGGKMMEKGTMGLSRVCPSSMLVRWYETGVSLLGKGW